MAVADVPSMSALRSRGTLFAVHWIRRYIVFHRKTHPSEMGAAEISTFLTWLAVERHVSASTQNQALSALLFLYKDVLGIEVGRLDQVPRARLPIDRKSTRLNSSHSRASRMPSSA